MKTVPERGGWLALQLGNPAPVLWVCFGFFFFFIIINFYYRFFRAPCSRSLLAAGYGGSPAGVFYSMETGA